MIKLGEFEEALITCLVCHLSVAGAVVPGTQQPLLQHPSTRLLEINEPSRVDRFGHFIPIDVRSLC